MHFNGILFAEFYERGVKNGNECNGRCSTVFFVLSAAHLDRSSRATWMPPKDVPRTIARLQVHRVCTSVQPPRRKLSSMWGLQPGCTDGAASFTRWLRFHDPFSKEKLAKQSATFPTFVKEMRLPRLPCVARCKESFSCSCILMRDNNVA